MTIVNLIEVIHGRGYKPLDLNEKEKNNMHGLCNQLFQIINRMAISEYDKPFIDMIYDTYIGPFSLDINEGDLILPSEILDLEEMNKYGYHFKDVKDFTPFENFVKFYSFDSPLIEYFKAPHIFADKCKHIVFSKKFDNIVKEIIKEKGLDNRQVNLAHLKIEPIAKEWCIQNNCLNLFEESLVKYKDAIYSLDKEIPLCLLVEEKNHPLVSEISKDYNTYFIDKELDLYPRLEEKYVNKSDIRALSDILFAKNLNVKTFIGKYENSSVYGVSTFSLFLHFYLNHENSISV
jgi:hypothetical protein